MNFENKIVLVTGGTSGIGLATANELKSKGATVIVTGRNPEKIQFAKEKYNLDALQCDVSQENNVVELYKYITDKYEKLDVLINNAGIGYFAKVDETSMDEFNSVMATNVTAPMMLTKEAAKIFKKQNSGAVVNIASTAALKGFPGGSAYVASKFALKGMTECWRAELRPYNVRVILINPSEVQTPFFGKEFNEESYNPTKLRAEDISHSIVSALEMNDRGFITELTVFATNPKV